MRTSAATTRHNGGTCAMPMRWHIHIGSPPHRPAHTLCTSPASASRCRPGPSMCAMPQAAASRRTCIVPTRISPARNWSAMGAERWVSNAPAPAGYRRAPANAPPAVARFVRRHVCDARRPGHNDATHANDASNTGGRAFALVNAMTALSSAPRTLARQSLELRLPSLRQGCSSA